MCSGSFQKWNIAWSLFHLLKKIINNRINANVCVEKNKLNHKNNSTPVQYKRYIPKYLVFSYSIFLKVWLYIMGNLVFLVVKKKKRWHKKCFQKSPLYWKQLLNIPGKSLLHSFFNLHSAVDFSHDYFVSKGRSFCFYEKLNRIRHSLRMVSKREVYRF